MLRIERSEMDGSIDAPPSKSHAIRYAVLAGLGVGTSELHNFPINDDTIDSIALLESLGSRVTIQDGVLRIKPTSSLNFRELHLKGSATVLRIAIAMAASYPGKKVITVTENLSRRPTAELIRALREAGASIRQDGTSIKIEEPVNSYYFTIDATSSSQFITSLVFLSIATGREVTIKIKGEVSSRAYLQITEDVVSKQGTLMKEEDSIITVRPSNPGKINVNIPGDFTLSAYFPVIAATNGRSLAIKGLSYSGTGDSRIVDIFRMAGVESRMEGDTWKVDESQGIEALDINMNDIPDLVPPVSSLVSSSRGTSRVSGIGHLVHKESNRISEIISILRASGVNASYDEEGLKIQGGKIQRNTYTSPEDHRMAMLAISMQARSGGMIINEGCVRKSYPGFIKDFLKIGGKVYYS